MYDRYKGDNREMGSERTWLVNSGTQWSKIYFLESRLALMQQDAGHWLRIPSSSIPTRARASNSQTFLRLIYLVTLLRTN